MDTNSGIDVILYLTIYVHEDYIRGRNIAYRIIH